MSIAQEATVVPPVGPWQHATVTAIRSETATVRTYALALPRPAPYLAGQHFVVRLTAPDGYRAQRSYSVASAPGDGSSLELTIERLPDGEVSTFLADEVVVGDQLEVRGPIGGWFVWEGRAPALLIGGGTGVVPLMAMLRLARREERQSLAHLVVSARTPAELVFADELRGSDASVVYTRVQPVDSTRALGRLTADDLRPHLGQDTSVYICGSAAFAGAATERVLEAGAPASRIRVERFGPSG